MATIHDALEAGSNYAESMTFCDETLDGEDLERVEFLDCTFERCRLSGCILERASLTNCTFVACDLANAKARGTWWVGCVLRDCRLDGMDLTDALFRQSRIEGSSLSYANLAHVSWDRTNVVDCRMREAFLQEMRIKHLTMERVDLTRADLFKTALRGMDLSSCDIEGITVSDDLHELRGLTVGPEQAMALVGLLGVKVAD